MLLCSPSNCNVGVAEELPTSTFDSALHCLLHHAISCPGLASHSPSGCNVRAAEELPERFVGGPGLVVRHHLVVGIQAGLHHVDEEGLELVYLRDEVGEQGDWVCDWEWKSRWIECKQGLRGVWHVHSKSEWHSFPDEAPYDTLSYYKLFYNTSVHEMFELNTNSETATVSPPNTWHLSIPAPLAVPIRHKAFSAPKQTL